MRRAALVCAISLHAFGGGARAVQRDQWLVSVPLPPISQQAKASRRPVWVPPVASLVLPGTGQVMQGHSRAVAYIAVEAWLWGRYATSLGDANFERNRYVDLAFTAARADFQPTIRDTVFQYFETVGKFAESGLFDTDPGPGFKPPTDPQSYNGSIWILALETFLPAGVGPPDENSPEYQRALEFYRARAVGPNFLWSWRDTPEQFQQYKDAVSDSDNAFKRSSQTLGFLLANHILSAFDAYVSQRLAQTGAPARIETAVWHNGGWLRRPVARLSVGFSF